MMRLFAETMWTRAGAPPASKREEEQTTMRVQIHKTDGASDADVSSRLETILASIGEHTVVDRSPDYLVVFSTGVDSKSAGDTLAADVGITGPDAAVWDSSTARIKHSVSINAAEEPRSITMSAESPEITEVFLPDANFTVTPAPDDEHHRGKKKK